MLEDERHTTALGVYPTTRYVYQGEWPTGRFVFQYIVNNTALTQEQIDAINSGITRATVESMVIPSYTQEGYAENAVRADNATIAEIAMVAGSAVSAEFATTATTANTADTAISATIANIALTANYAPDYTPLSTFN